ncbi:hypothetical protein NC653_006789 [Populus alba x Populus x berolinensis]|uniref:Uncharacterized protein n=1 Tax=Populus alba x Populus x berolinensis TaxID=444605 RepID=A0AAD6RFL6_9ROSI|nr:hypothetical protein NC653_006789 [Populus alba x Populus x berolinensis]
MERRKERKETLKGQTKLVFLHYEWNGEH